MGCVQSKTNLFTNANGDGKDFLEKYSVDRIIGQGEFGVVKIVYDRKDDRNPIACKILRKGIQFKDNTIYSPIKPHVLKSECGILQLLGGKHHTLKLIGVYESPSALYILTDYLAGGDMFQHLSDYYGATTVNKGTSSVDDTNNNGLSTEDVSRMSFELLDAINHCTKHGIIHRDVKPENIMFEKPLRGSSLKLIDFGSGTFAATSNEAANKSKSIEYDLNNPRPPGMDEEETTKIQNFHGEELYLHTTFAGSAFYISPEMFQKHYTVATDVWSVGVTLYVLVAGYPADALQKAFNQLQTNDRTIDSLKNLPHMPNNMPDTYYQLLDHCLTYKHRMRKSAATILETSEFVKFHHENQKADNDDDKDKKKSILIQGSVSRHTAMLKYGQYERSVTSLIASLLEQRQLAQLLDRIDEVLANSEESKRLQIITIGELHNILKNLEYHHLLPTFDKVAHGIDYSKYAYHVAFLRQFYTLVQGDKNEDGKYKQDMDTSTSRKWNSVVAKRKPGINKIKEEKAKPRSIHNGNAWETISKQYMNKAPRRLSN